MSLHAPRERMQEPAPSIAPAYHGVTQGELSGRFPLSPLFALKQSLPLLALIAVMLSLYFFGGPNFTTSIENLRNSLGVEKPVIYYSACGTLLALVVYWLLYIQRFRFGISQEVFYIKKGVFIQSVLPQRKMEFRHLPLSW